MIRVDTLKKEHPELLKTSDEFIEDISKNTLKFGKNYDEIEKIT